jgi:hypothetical protein
VEDAEGGLDDSGDCHRDATAHHRRRLRGDCPDGRDDCHLQDAIVLRHRQLRAGRPDDPADCPHLDATARHHHQLRDETAWYCHHPDATVPRLRRHRDGFRRQDDDRHRQEGWDDCPRPVEFLHRLHPDGRASNQ